MKLVSSILIILVSTAVYWGSLQHQFALDDLIHITTNQDIRILTKDSSKELFLKSTYPGNLYRPLVTLSYAVTYHFAGLDPFFYHLTNLVLHILVALMVFLVLSHIFDQVFATVVAFLFAIHPMQVEAVANVSGRSELMAALFGLLALRFAIMLDREPWQKFSIIIGILAPALILVSYSAALFSKESSLVFFMLIPLLFITKHGLIKGISRSILPLLVMTVAASGYFYFRSLALGGTILPHVDVNYIDNPLFPLSPENRVLNAVLLLGRYIQLLLIPLGFSADYSFAVIKPITNWQVIDWNVPELQTQAAFSGLLLLSIVLGGLRGRKHALFSLWFILAFAITSNIAFPIGTIFAERLAYLPSIGVIGLVCLVLFSLNIDMIAGIGFSFLAVIYIAQTIVHVGNWRDNTTLFSYQITVSPESTKTQTNYAVVLRNQEKLGESESHFRQALRIYPENVDAQFGIGSTYIMRGDLVGAKEWFSKALQTDPTHPPSSILLGQILLNEGSYGEARRLFLNVLNENPSNLDARIGMLAVYINLDDLDAARKLRDELTRLNPGNAEISRLGTELDLKIPQTSEVGR